MSDNGRKCNADDIPTIEAPTVHHLNCGSPNGAPRRHVSFQNRSISSGSVGQGFAGLL